MTRVTFETAGLADVLKKVKAIAPTRGEGFDKAAGIVIRIFPSTEDNFALVEATDLNLFYREWVPVLESTATAEVVWRVASRIADVVAALPIGSGRSVVLHDEAKEGGRTLQIQSGRLKSSWQMIDPEYYPQWDSFDPDDCTPIENFGNRIAMVEWAAGTDVAHVFSGVNLDGKWAVATDAYRLARVPLPISAPWMEEGESITVPSKLLAQLVKQTGTVSVGATPTQLLVIPDPSVQIRTSLFASKWPARGISKLTDQEYDVKLEAPKSPLVDLINRAMILLATDRTPMLQVFIGKGEIAVHAVDGDDANLGDVLEVPGYADHPRVRYLFTPKFLIEAIEKSPGDRIELSYSSIDPICKVRFSDGGGYNCWVVPKQPQAALQEGES